MPCERIGRRPTRDLFWQSKWFSVKRVIVTPVLELLADSPTHLDFAGRSHGHVPPIEESMEIRSQQETIVDAMFSALLVRSDVRSLEDRKSSLTGDRATPIVDIRHQNSERALTETRLHKNRSAESRSGIGGDAR
jgi:hypothetical protein